MADGTTKSGVQTYDPQTGMLAHLPPEEAAKQYVAGKVQLVHSLDYPMRATDGSIWDVPAAEVADAMRKGAQFASHGEVIRADAKSAGSGVQAAAEGAFRVVGGDAILTQAGVEPEAIQARREEWPVASGVGTAVGAVGLSALGGGALAGAAEAGVQAALGEQLAAGAVARLGAYGVGQAAEGAVVGAGMGVSEAALGNPEDAAETILANAGAGALLSGVFGTGARAAGMGVRAAGRQTLATYRKLASKIPGGMATLEEAKTLRAGTEAAEAEARALAEPAFSPGAQAAIRVGARVAAPIMGGGLGGVLGAFAARGLADEAGDLLARANVGQLAKFKGSMLSAADAIEAGAGRLLSGATPALEAANARLGPLTAAMLSGSASERESAFKERAAEVEAMATNPEATADAWGARTAQLASAAPGVHGVFNQRMADALEYIRGQIPATLAGDALAEGADAIQVPEHARTEFARVDAAVQDPTRILRPDATGAEIDAVAAVYPRLHATMTTAIMNKASSAMSWEGRKRLAYNWNLSTHTALDPISLGMLQRSYAPKPPGPGRPPKPKGRSPSAMMSEADRIQYSPRGGYR